MANHFRQTAQRLREIASTASHISADQREDLEYAARTLCRLEQLKHDFIASAVGEGDDVEADRLTLELVSVLGLHMDGEHGS